MTFCLCIYIPVPLLEISIDGCRIVPLAGKIRQKALKEVSGLKIDGCMHTLLKIYRYSCTHHTRSKRTLFICGLDRFLIPFALHLSICNKKDITVEIVIYLRIVKTLQKA